eukprot:TRINITY_DN47148_c0_g1_i1.p1 TRINITY_DN47148_c0_g1~~TRINITY_DN47148_c0_g1_i1.p1  ORF type:complete len:517 (+),score=236.22 TRINITY_DN47148_c0_g1_i1:48-1598(+)
MTEQVSLLKAELIENEGDFNDVQAARTRSQRMKEVMTTAPIKIVREVTALKEQALELEKELDEKDGVSKKNEQDKNLLQSEIKALKDDTERSKKDAERKKLELHKVNSDRQIYTELVHKAEAQQRGPTLPYDNGGMYLRFLTGRGSTAAMLHSATIRFQSHTVIDPKDWADRHLKTLVKEAKEFTEELKKAGEELKILDKLAGKLEQVGADHEVSTTDITNMYNECEEVFGVWKKKLEAEEERRVNYETGVDDFMKEQLRLIEWCRTQKDTLSRLPASENVQEFCASLQGRIPTMEENFAVLTGMGEDLIPGPQQKLVEKVLIDVSKAWIDLQIFSYEKLREALLDEHNRSGLKEEATRYAEWASQNVKQFLDQVEELLKSPEESSSKDIVRPVLDMCKALQNDYAPHQLIVEHISDFDVRMEVINDHYKYLKRTITSNLTFLCQKLNAFSSGYARKAEYEEKLHDLTDWIDIRDSNTSSWRIVHSKLSDIHQTLEAEAELDRKQEEIERARRGEE